MSIRTIKGCLEEDSIDQYTVSIINENNDHDAIIVIQWKSWDMDKKEFKYIKTYQANRSFINKIKKVIQKVIVNDK